MKSTFFSSLKALAALGGASIVLLTINACSPIDRQAPYFTAFKEAAQAQNNQDVQNTSVDALSPSVGFYGTQPQPVILARPVPQALPRPQAPGYVYPYYHHQAPYSPVPAPAVTDAPIYAEAETAAVVEDEKCAVSEYGIATSPLNIRKDASMNGKIIGVLPKNQRGQVLFCAENWCRINYKGTVGYSAMDYLELIQGVDETCFAVK